MELGGGVVVGTVEVVGIDTVVDGFEVDVAGGTVDFAGVVDLEVELVLECDLDALLLPHTLTTMTRAMSAGTRAMERPCLSRIEVTSRL